MKHSYTAGQNTHQYNHFNKRFGYVWKLKTHIPYDPANPLLGLYRTEMSVNASQDIGMLLEALESETASNQK